MKNEGLLKAPHSSERLQSYEYFRHTPNVLRLFYQLTIDLIGIKDNQQLILFPLHLVHLHAGFALAQKPQLNLYLPLS